MSKPDSLLNAARRLAQVSGLAWSEVLPFYRALQDNGGPSNDCWLPKSAGRNIWAAHPNFIARLMFALGGADSVSGAHEAVELARKMTPGGREKHLDEQDAAGVLAPLEREFFEVLTDFEAAMRLTEVEFRLDRGEIAIVRHSGTTIYSVPKMKLPDEPAGKMIYKRGVIKGVVFRAIASQTKWRLADQAPFETAKPGDDLGD